MLKKLYTSLLALLACLSLLACQSQTTPAGSAKDKTNKQTPTVTVTTSFLQDMVQQVAGDLVKIELMIPAGEDPHLYVPKSSDFQKLKQADLVLYHGLHFEGKMVQALESTGVAVTKDFKPSDLSTMEEEGETLIDPHFWFDIDLYKQATQTAAQALSQLLPDAAGQIKANTQAYLAELDALDRWISENLASIPTQQRYLITPHDAFQYFARSYNFNLYAPQGISTDSEVANSDMKATVDLILKHRIKAIFSESTTNPERMEKLQESVKAAGGQVQVVSGHDKELFSDSLAPQGQAGDTYIDMYRHNVQLILEHLK